MKNSFLAAERVLPRAHALTLSDIDCDPQKLRLAGKTMQVLVEAEAADDAVVVASTVVVAVRQTPPRANL